MDTKTLVVGQRVRVQSGKLFREAVVEEVTEEYVRVFVAPTGPFAKWLPKLKLGEPPRQVEFPPSPENKNENGFSLDFRYDGVQCGVVEAGGVWDSRPLCTEFGPWKLVER
jgi:hypothetical protein